MTSTGRLLRGARRSAGLTQRQLAVKAEVPQPTVARIEAGRVHPRSDTLERLLRVTGYELELMPILGRGIDRTLIRDRLRLTPEERLRLAASEANAMAGIRFERRRR